MKTYDYIIVFKKKNYGTIDGISQFMLLISLIAFIRFSVLHPKYMLIPMIISLLILGWWIFCYTQLRRNVRPSYRLALLLSAVGWYFQPDGIWISLIYLIASVLEKQAKFQEEIAFDAEEIVLNSFPKKKFSWNELNNVVLKDGLLTVDFKNNKLIQKEVDSEVTPQVEAEFNHFAKSHLPQ